MADQGENVAQEGAGNEVKPHPEPDKLVPITVNGPERMIHRGRRSVSEIKTVGEVPQADALEQLIDGTLVPLEDNGSVTIKGREEFFSHPKDGGSS